MKDIVSLDFETRSATDIKRGLERYSKDPNCEVLTLSYRMPGQDIWRWHRGPHLLDGPDPERDSRLGALLRHVEAGGLVRGWNVNFEWTIWNNVCAPKYGWPELKIEQCIDTMAQAAACNLPQGLGKCAEAMGLQQQKDKRGSYLIQRLCVPHPPTKSRPGIWVEDPELFAELCDYCDQDVVVEETIARKLRPLTEEQQRMWVMTQKVNQRGVPVDLDECRGILAVVEAEKERLNRELRALTGRRVVAASKRVDLLGWVNERMADRAPIGIEDPVDNEEDRPGHEEALVDLKGKTVEAALARNDLPDDVRRALEIRAAVVQTSTAKFSKMISNAADDGTLKGMYVWHGAGTGRWASRGGINCFTGEVEVLTPAGWVRFDEWDGGPIMQWWPDGTMDFCANPDRVESRFDGELVRVEAPLLDVRMTPEHRLVFWNEGKYRETTAAHLLKTGRLSGVPMGGVWSGSRSSRYTPDEVRLLVALAADGSRKERSTTAGSVSFGFRKARKVERLTAILGRLGVTYTMSEYPPQRGHSGDQPTVCFRLADCPYPKGFGPWILELDREALDALVDELAYWDGWKHSKTGATQFCTADREQAQWVATALHLSGAGAAVREYAERRFQLHARERGSFTTVRAGQVSAEGYSGPVYCASVDSSYILIRGNGKIAVTGQCQNFARPALPKGEIQIALDVLGRGDHAAALALWGDRTMDAAVSCLRGVLKAPPGFEFIDADYSSVENRVGVWLAGQDDKLEMFRQGLDEYRQFSSTSLHKVPYDQVTGDMRQMSKSAVLGCLFGQGWRGLISYSAGYGVALTDERSQEVVKLYRAEYRKVRDLWYRCGDASIGAVRAPGAWFKAGDKLALICHKNFLWLKLPSGRLIAWSRPRVEMREAPWMEKFIAGYDDDGDKIIGERPAMREVVTVESIETKTRQYVRHPLIGSSIFQSGVQGTAADILGEGLLNVEAAGYSVRMLTHDELTALVPAGRGDPDEFGRLMCLPAPWREDLPLAYEAWQSGRFRK